MPMSGWSRAQELGAPPQGALREAITAELRRWPSVGVGIGVVRSDSPVESFVHGVAEVASGRPVDDRTVFRVGSLTKTITAVAVMQLCERGLVDLDAPTNDYLRAFKLVPAKAEFGSPTVRHLLTHTAGLGYWRRRSDLLRHPGVGAGVAARSVVRPSELYRDGLVFDVEPGTRWMYSNHGFAALGQIVEDVTGVPVERYLREHVFGPLGMDQTDLVRSERVRGDLATGYRLGRRGLVPVPFGEVPLPAAGGVYSSIADMSCYLTALLHGGANQHGRVLDPDSVRSMFRPHFRPDPRLAGMGLGFEPHTERDRVLIGKGGTLNGFLAALELAPQEGVGVVVLTNTGGLDNRGIPEPLAAALTRRLLDLPPDPVRDDVVPHPEVWKELCGWYAPDAGPNTNLFLRVGYGAGIEVAARHGHLVMMPLQPVPGVAGAMVMHPDDPQDPHVFRVEFAKYEKTSRVVFTRDTPPRLLVDVMSFRKQPDWTSPRRWATGVAVAGALAVARRYAGRRSA